MTIGILYILHIYVTDNILIRNYILDYFNILKTYCVAIIGIIFSDTLFDRILKLLIESLKSRDKCNQSVDLPFESLVRTGLQVFYRIFLCLCVLTCKFKNYHLSF